MYCSCSSSSSSLNSFNSVLMSVLLPFHVNALGMNNCGYIRHHPFIKYKIKLELICAIKEYQYILLN